MSQQFSFLKDEFRFFIQPPFPFELGPGPYIEDYDTDHLSYLLSKPISYLASRCHQQISKVSWYAWVEKLEIKRENIEEISEWYCLIYGEISSLSGFTLSLTRMAGMPECLFGFP
jgi:hypothetical protein